MFAYRSKRRCSTAEKTAAERLMEMVDMLKEGYRVTQKYKTTMISS